MLAWTTVLGPTAVPAFAEKLSETATPIPVLVVIFQENVSFDHYFGTYPVATNPDESEHRGKEQRPDSE